MKKRQITTALATASLLLATANLRAGDPQTSAGDKDYSHSGDRMAAGSCIRASSLLGREVQTDTGDKLGKVKDLVINLDSHRAPICIVAFGGALGMGEKLVAVPFHDLKWSPDTQILALATTKDKFQSSPQTPSGEWAAFASQDWSKNIDRYYGEPGPALTSRFEREPMAQPREGEENVRENLPAQPQKGGEQLKYGTPNSTTDVDRMLSQRITATINQDAGDSASQIQSKCENGVVTLTGTVPNQQEKQRIEQDLKALPGVEKVDDQLTVKE